MRDSVWLGRHGVGMIASPIGRTDEQIALIMDTKVSTTRSYMADLREAFGVCSRTELARMAQRAGLIGIEDAIP